MSLKTATLIAAICMVTHFALSVFWMFGNATMGFSPFVGQAFWLLNMLLFDGGLVLFFIVLYCKQKK